MRHHLSAHYRRAATRILAKTFGTSTAVFGTVTNLVGNMDGRTSAYGRPLVFHPELEHWNIILHMLSKAILIYSRNAWVLSSSCVVLHRDYYQIRTRGNIEEMRIRGNTGDNWQLLHLKT